LCKEYIVEGCDYDPIGGGHIDPCCECWYGYATGATDAYDPFECTGG
jgi:hypothetical protein